MSTNLRQVCLLGQDSPTNEPARQPAHRAKLTDFGGALESAPKGVRTTGLSIDTSVIAVATEHIAIR